MFSSNNPPATPKAPKPKPFVPEFETPPVVVNPYGGSEHLNPSYFATQDTALALMLRFGGTSTFQKPLDLGGGFTFNPPSVGQWFIRFETPAREPKEINAGLLADYFVRGPEAEFPGWAESGVRDALSHRGIF